MGTVIFGADSRLDQDTLTVSVAADADFPTANLNDDRAFTKYKMGSAATELLIKTDSGGPTVGVDYLMLVGHDLFDPDNDGNGAVLVEFQHSSDDISYTTVSTLLPGNNKIIARTFTLVFKRFFRLRLTRGTAFKASFGELQWGQAVRPKIGVRVGFDPQDETIEGQFNRSRSGNIIGAIRTHSMRRARVRLELISDSLLRGLFLKFWDGHASKLKPFLFWWNDGNPGSFEPDAFFGIVDPGRGIMRPLRTQLDVGFRDLEFTVVGLKE